MANKPTTDPWELDRQAAQLPKPAPSADPVLCILYPLAILIAAFLLYTAVVSVLP